MSKNFVPTKIAYAVLFHLALLTPTFAQDNEEIPTITSDQALAGFDVFPTPIVRVLSDAFSDELKGEIEELVQQKFRSKFADLNKQQIEDQFSGGRALVLRLDFTNPVDVGIKNLMALHCDLQVAEYVTISRDGKSKKVLASTRTGITHSDLVYPEVLESKILGGVDAVLDVLLRRIAETEK